MAQNSDMADDLVSELESVVRQAGSRLKALSESAAEHRPRTGGWSAKEILGHLIDSASHNHQRFVAAQLRSDLEFPGYSQDSWVAAQRYQDADWSALVGLWKAYNLHLVHVISAIPPEVLYRERPQHNLHRIAWRPVPRGQPATLDDFIRDYVDHLRHHLAQIFEAAGHRP